MSKFFNYMKKFLALSFILTISAFCLSLNCIASDTNIPNSPIGSDYAVQGAEAMRSYTDPETGNSFTLHTRHPEGQEPERYAVWHWNKKEEKTIVVPREVISMGEKYPLRGLQSSATMIAPVVLDVDCFNMTVDSTVSLDPRSLPNVLKVIIRNIDNDTSDTQNVTGLEDQNKTVADLLEANSLTGNSAVYLTKDDGKNVYIGESDLFYADDKEDVVTSHGLRYEWDEQNEKWILTSFPNIQNLIIPAAFVDSNDLSLEKIEGVIINDQVKKDKIQKIIVTNIQDDAHKEKILKFARMILPGLENNVDDGEEWTVEDEVSSTGRLTFIKAQRQLMPVINKTVSAIALWAQTKPWNRLDKNGMMSEFRSIINANFKTAPRGAEELKDLLMDFLGSFVSTEEFDYFVNAYKSLDNNLVTPHANDGSDQMSFNLIDMSDESAQDDAPLPTIMFNTFSDLKNWAQDKPWLNFDNEELMKQFKTIVDKNFEKAPQRAKYLKDLFMTVMQNLVSSEHFDSFIDAFKAMKQQLLTSSDEDASSEIPVDLNDMEKQYEVDAITTPYETDKPEENSYDDGQSPSNTQIQPSVTYEKILADWQLWKENAGKNVAYADQIKYLRDLLLQSLSSLNATDRESAKNAINLINSELEKMNNKTQNTGYGSQTLNNSSSTGSTNSNVQTSAKTKTADSNISPEFMSLVLSGALSGIVVSLKKNKE